VLRTGRACPVIDNFSTTPDSSLLLDRVDNPSLTLDQLDRLLIASLRRGPDPGDKRAGRLARRPGTR
jgi:hypothetical protein